MRTVKVFGRRWGLEASLSFFCCCPRAAFVSKLDPCLRIFLFFGAGACFVHVPIQGVWCSSRGCSRGELDCFSGFAHCCGRVEVGVQTDILDEVDAYHML